MVDGQSKSEKGQRCHFGGLPTESGFSSEKPKTSIVDLLDFGSEVPCICGLVGVHPGNRLIRAEEEAWISGGAGAGKPKRLLRDRPEGYVSPATSRQLSFQGTQPGARRVNRSSQYPFHPEMASRAMEGQKDQKKVDQLRRDWSFAGRFRHVGSDLFRHRASSVKSAGGHVCPEKSSASFGEYPVGGDRGQVRIYRVGETVRNSFAEVTAAKLASVTLTIWSMGMRGEPPSRMRREMRQLLLHAPCPV